MSTYIKLYEDTIRTYSNNIKIYQYISTYFKIYQSILKHDYTVKIHIYI